MILALKDINSDVLDVKQYTNTLTYETKRAYEHDIKEFFKVNDLNNITPNMIQSISFTTINYYILELEERGDEPATISRKISALSKMFDCCIEWGYVQKNPIKSKLVKRIKVKNYSTTKSMKLNEIKEIVNNIDNQRDRLLIKLMFKTMIRRSELCNIKLADIKNLNGYWIIEIVKGKGNKPRLVKINQEIKNLIDKYINSNNREYLFIGESRNHLNGNKLSGESIRRIIKKYFPKGFTPHSLRHSAATEARRLGNYKIEQLQEVLGHENISTTRRYVHNIDYLENNPSDILDL